MDTATCFQQHRAHLHGLAYRMLGAVSDADDVLQDAWLRWHHLDVTAIDNPRAYLTTIVSRLCLDRLREARRHREHYVGPWLPEPVVVGEAEEHLAQDISYALMLALERLSPLERAAFLLHDVFDLSFGDIAATLERSEAACRQLAKRARQHIRTPEPRFAVQDSENEQLAAAFFQASRAGDTKGLQQLLLDSATLHSDGGGRRLAALRIITGADKICRLFAGLARKFPVREPLWQQPLVINGEPGWLTMEPDGMLQATSFQFEGGRIAAVYLVRNPDKLQHLMHLVPADLAIQTPIAQPQH